MLGKCTFRNDFVFIANEVNEEIEFLFRKCDWIFIDEDGLRQQIYIQFVLLYYIIISELLPSNNRENPCG